MTGNQPIVTTEDPKHALAKEERQMINADSSASRGMLPPRSSSSGVSMLMKQYKEKERLNVQQNYLKGTIDLAPLLKISYGQIHVEFTIGNKRKYVLKNTQIFADALRRGEFITYGKELEFYHTLEVFTEQSRPLAEFLLQEAEIRRLTSRSLDYYDHKKGRYVTVHSGNIDHFFQALGSMEFAVEMNYSSRQMWKVSSQKCPLELVIREEGDGVALETETVFYTYGRAYAYVWKNGAVFPVPVEQAREIEPFWEYLDKYKYDKFFVERAELPVFCRELLPVLERHYLVEKQQFHEADYLPPKPQYEIYLDHPQPDTVTCEMSAVYGDRKYNVYEKPRMLEQRDELEELKAREQVRRWFQNTDPRKNQMILADDEERLYQFLTQGIAALSVVGAVYISDALKSMEVREAPKVSVGVSLKGNLLELTFESQEMPLSELLQILSAYKKKRKFFRLKNGDFLSMEEGGLAVLSRIQEAAGISAAQWEQGSVTLPKYRALYLDHQLKNQKGFYTVKDKSFRALIRNMKTVEDNDFELPKSLGTVLREYQKQGFLWLKTLKANGFAGVLADDMGLGKTIEIIAFLLSEWEEGRAGASSHFALIVCPSSLIYNWQKEIERFAPRLRTVAVTGTASVRRELIADACVHEILITSYELLRRDLAHYEKCCFGYEIIDEAQYIKNHTTKAARAVKAIRADFRAALTGTPIENRLSELWSIFDYLMPGFLFTYQRFREELELPVVSEGDEEARDRLRNMIRPFVLRRLKEDVLDDLPEKMEEAVFARMQGEQERLYRAHVQRLQMMLQGQSEKEFASQKIQVLSELTRLRQICCDPALVYEDFEEESAKSAMCIELIHNALQGGHRVLLFSQFTTMLDRLQQRLKEEHISYLSLTGAVSREKRLQLVEKFQNGRIPVFCISLKAGGTGLNLTAADLVIHYDPWWNVAVQNQATDRAYRIGQKNPVTVYKLIAQNTIEENILKLQKKKSLLAEQLLGNEGFEGVKFTREELLELLG
ncbi:MAG: helicase [Lachnospiraceae bacterium]|nr:helicase [Lachnospiraceae bacterium]